jgi:hypothetical protein
MHQLYFRYPIHLQVQLVQGLVLVPTAAVVVVVVKAFSGLLMVMPPNHHSRLVVDQR